MSFNNPYNSLDSAYQGEKISEEGNLQAKATSIKKTKESIAEGLGGGLGEQAGIGVLKGLGKKAFSGGKEIAEKVAPKAVGALSDLTEGVDDAKDTKGVIKTVGKNIISKARDFFTKSVSQTVSTAENKATAVRGSVNRAIARPARGGQQVVQDALQQTRDSEAINDTRVAQQAQMNSRLASLQQADDVSTTTAQGAPAQPAQAPKQTYLGDDDEGKPAVEEDDPEFDADAPPDEIDSGSKISQDLRDAGKIGSKVAESGEEMSEIDSAGGFDPVVDAIGLGVGLYTLFSGLHSADKVKPPTPPPMAMASFQLGA